MSLRGERLFEDPTSNRRRQHPRRRDGGGEDEGRGRVLISAARTDGSKQTGSPSPNEREPKESCCPGPTSRRGSTMRLSEQTPTRRFSREVEWRLSPGGTFAFSGVSVSDVSVWVWTKSRTPQNRRSLSPADTKGPAGASRRRVLTPSAFPLVVWGMFPLSGCTRRSRK